MSLNKFISEVKTRGLARHSHYEVRFTLPGTNSDGDRLASVFCAATNLPGKSFATQPSRIYGENREMPYETMYDPVTFSFYSDSGMELKKAFDRWMGLVIDPNTRFIQYYENYTRDVEVKLINIDESEPYQITLFEAYPKNIQAIQLDYSNKEAMRFDVTIQYRYWRSTSTSSMSLGTASTLIPAQDPQNFITGLGFPEFMNTNIFDV